MAPKGKRNDDTSTDVPAMEFNPWLDLTIVVTFLTRLPFPAAGHAYRPLAKAAWAFPFAGILTGGVGGGVFYGAFLAGTPLLIALILGLATSVLVSGGLHEDGLADVADGFGGGTTLKKKLAIMHDSRIGTYGVLALIFGISLRLTALVAIAAAAGPQATFAAFLAVGIFSRAVLPAVMAALPNARTDGLSKDAGRPDAAGVIISLTLGLIGAIAPFHGNYQLVAVAIPASVAAVFILGLIARRQIGGQTGDVIGAAQQVAEIAFLIALSVTLGGIL